jgi:hypothetical protein
MRYVLTVKGTRNEAVDAVTARCRAAGVAPAVFAWGSLSRKGATDIELVVAPPDERAARGMLEGWCAEPLMDAPFQSGTLLVIEESR